MPLLLNSEYERLSESGLTFVEDEGQRFFIFVGVSLEERLYTVPMCDVLVVIPPNYPQAGNDMFWTSPPLQRTNGASIPQVFPLGGSDNRFSNGREFCRWSRHWDPSSPGAWRPGKDDILSIYRRVDWALRHPDC
jgi:hypothetical protein